MRNAHSLVLAAALLSLAAPDRGRPISIESSAYRVEMPGGASMAFIGRRKTPWGMATFEYHTSTDNAGIVYLFAPVTPDHPRELSGARLARSKAYFLIDRKCTAVAITDATIRDAGGNVWPQSSFAGSCAAAGDFEVVALIAYGRLYHFQVTNERFSSTATPSPRARLPDKRALHDALTRFVAHARFSPPSPISRLSPPLLNPSHPARRTTTAPRESEP